MSEIMRATTVAGVAASRQHGVGPKAFGVEGFGGISKVAIWTSVVSTAFAIALVVVDLGRQLRVWHGSRDHRVDRTAPRGPFPCSPVPLICR